MIRCGAKSPNGPLVLMGLSEGNVERLKADRPIRARLDSFVPGMSGEIVVVYGKTEHEIERRLRESRLISEVFTTVIRDEEVDRQHAVREAHKHVLIATVGLPRSGKTTWARSQAYPIVSPDSIRLALHGQRFYGPAEPFVWATAKLMVRSLFLAGHKTVILDSTMCEKKRRDEWVSKEWGLFFKHVDTGKEECLARAEESKDEDIKSVIERMAAAFEPLTPEEKAW